MERCCLPTSFMEAGPALQCSVSPREAAEHPGEMSSRWKLGQYVKSHGDLQLVEVVLTSYPSSGRFSHCPVLWGAKLAINLITKAPFFLGRHLENFPRTGVSAPGKWLTSITHSCFWSAVGNLHRMQHGGRGMKKLRKAMASCALYCAQGWRQLTIQYSKAKTFAVHRSWKSHWEMLLKTWYPSLVTVRLYYSLYT